MFPVSPLPAGVRGDGQAGWAAPEVLLADVFVQGRLWDKAGSRASL